MKAAGTHEPGPHHSTPPCQHFSRCGGCQLQHADEATLTDFVTSRVLNAAQGQGMEPAELLPTHLSPPMSRRRATFHALRTKKGAVIGFRESGSHTIVDLKQCEILHPDLNALIDPLRALVAAHGGKGGIDVTLAKSERPTFRPTASPRPKLCWISRATIRWRGLASITVLVRSRFGSLSLYLLLCQVY